MDMFLQMTGWPASPPNCVNALKANHIISFNL